MDLHLIRAAVIGCIVAGHGAVAEAVQLTPVSTTPPLQALPLHVGGRAITKATPGKTFGGRSYTYQWPGTHFDAAFTGSQLYLRLGEQPAVILHLSVDGGAPILLKESKAGSYELSGLRNGPHRVRLTLVTENQPQASTFLGFAVPASAHPLPAPAYPRQMDLIGDSYTLGYGVASATRDCTGPEVMNATDTERTAGVLTALQYGADFRVEAISGRGVVRNYGGAHGSPIPQAYPFVLEDGQAHETVHSAWQPQVIIIGLGTNDFSTPLQPGEPWKSRSALHAAFQHTYVDFVHSLRAKYPKAYFILWATDIAHGEVTEQVSAVTATLHAQGEKRVEFIPVSNLAITGCHFHPSVADNLKIYSEFKSFIDARPGLWQERLIPRDKVARPGVQSLPSRSGVNARRDP